MSSLRNAGRQSLLCLGCSPAGERKQQIIYWLRFCPKARHVTSPHSHWPRQVTCQGFHPSFVWRQEAALLVCSQALRTGFLRLVGVGFSFSIDFAPAAGQALLWALGKHSSKQSQAPCSQGPGILAGDPMPISAPVVCSQGACLLFPNQESCRALCWAPTAAFVGTLLTLF